MTYIRGLSVELWLHMGLLLGHFYGVIGVNDAWVRAGHWTD
jgi:hypothetical protein